MEVPGDAQSEQQKISSEATPDQDLSSASSKENKDLTENMDINTSEGSSDQDLGSSNEKRILKEDIVTSKMEVPDDAESEQQKITSEAPSDHDSSSASSKENKDSAKNIDSNTSEIPCVQESGSSNEKRILEEDIQISTLEVPDDAQSDEQQNITSEATSDQDSSSALSKQNKDLAENIDIAVDKNTSEVPSVQDSGSSNEKRILEEDILISTLEVPDDAQSDAQQNITSEATSDQDSSSALSKQNKDLAENIDIAVDKNTSEVPSVQDSGSSNEKRILEEDILISTLEVPDDAQSDAQQNITSEATSDQDSSSALSKQNKDLAENIDIAVDKNTSEVPSVQDSGSSNEKRILEEDILISTMEVPDDAQSTQQNITSEATSDQDSSSAPSKQNKDLAENIDIAVNKDTSEVPSVQDSDSSNEKKILKEDILIVQSLIEKCMHSYMSRREIVQTLQNRDSIDPWFTTLVWQELEKQNADYFKTYCTVIELINKLNLLEKQVEMMKGSASPTVEITPQRRANKLRGPLALTFGTTALGVAHKSEASTSAGHSRENLRHLAHVPRAFGFTNLVSDSANLEDLGPLGNYFGTPHLPSFRPVQSDEVNTEAKDQVHPDSMQDSSNSQ